jgi:hypothetical protein
VSMSCKVAEFNVDNSPAAVSSLRSSTRSLIRSSPAAACSVLARIVQIVARQAAVA